MPKTTKAPKGKKSTKETKPGKLAKKVWKPKLRKAETAPLPFTVSVDNDSTNAEHLERIRHAQTKISGLEDSIADEKAHLKELKAELLAAQKKLREEIYDRNLRLGFDEKSGEGGEGDEAAKPGDAPDTGAPDTTGDDDTDTDTSEE